MDITTLPPGRAAPKPRLLVVEDEFLIAADISASLEKLGYSLCSSAQDGAAAVQIAQAERPGLVLMDIHLKGARDGISTAAEISALNIPVVFLTAYADEATLARARVTKPYGFLLKPFNERELHATIQVALERFRTDSELIESRKMLVAQLDDAKNDALIDPLTKAWNRKGMEEMLHAEMERARRANQRVALMLLDIDHFKQVNDRFGHMSGDHVLKETAKRIRACLRPSDIVARFGGDEFLMFAGSCSEETAGTLAERILNRISRRAFSSGAQRFPVTATIGVASSAVTADLSTDTLIEHADAALYDAKSQARNCFRVATSFAGAWVALAPKALASP
jgi:diguanylate cyclase (GGDEF)-like protein